MFQEQGACSAAWFADSVNGELVNGRDAHFECVQTDSRSVVPGSLFVALKGERSDGHDFVRAAADAGASAVLVSGSWWAATGKALLYTAPVSVLVVPDPLVALQQAATAWRRLFPSLLRFGVTGSTGKTSSKELLAAILGTFRKMVKNPGNLNSDIGLPASIFLMRSAHEAAIFEMGINRMGEMDTLASIYEPDCAIITNTGSAHIGVLGGTKASVAEQKKRVASRFDGHQTLVVWEDDEHRDLLMSGIHGTCQMYGPRSTDGFEGARDLGVGGWLVRYHGLDARLHLPGAHNLLNALGAIHAAALYGASPENVAAGLESVAALPGRTAIKHGAFLMVDDCYNANAESMAAAIDFCDSVNISGKRIYVLGSMKELGSESAGYHQKVGGRAAVSKAGILFFFGLEAREAYDAAKAGRNDSTVRFFEDYHALEQEVVSIVEPGDLVLVKASRSMALERLTERLAVMQAETGGTHVS